MQFLIFRLFKKTRKTCLWHFNTVFTSFYSLNFTTNIMRFFLFVRYVLTLDIRSINKKIMETQCYKTVTGSSVSPTDEAIKSFLCKQDMSDVISSFKEFIGLIVISDIPHELRISLYFCHQSIIELLKDIEKATSLDEKF